MRAQVSRWGNSLAIRLPRAAAQSLGVQAGEPIDLVIKGDRLEIRAARPRYRLAELVDQITPDNQPEIVRRAAGRRGAVVSEVPDTGDLVWLNFNPQAGHEQAGHRPALVLSPRIYHERTAFAVVCPITSDVMPYPFKVMLPEGLPIGGAVLADQVKSIDRGARQLRVAGPAPSAILLEVQAKLAALLGLAPD